MRVNFDFAEEAMISRYGSGPSPGQSPVPWAAFKLLREVDGLLASLATTSTPAHEIRFRPVMERKYLVGLDIELLHHPPDAPKGTKITAADMDDQAMASFRARTDRIRAIVDTLEGDDRTNVLSLAFESLYLYEPQEFWSRCSVLTIRTGVETILGPEASLRLKALEEGAAMQNDTPIPTPFVVPPAPRF